MRTGEGVWPRVMKRENMGLGEEGRTGSVMAERRERERQRSTGGERENGRKEEGGPVTVINWDPQKN